MALRRAVSQVSRLEQKLNARNTELEETAAKLAVANERMKRDREAAARTQQAFLAAVPPELPDARFAWTFRPCSRLAGDFFNIFQLDDRHLGLYVLDGEHFGMRRFLATLEQTRHSPLDKGLDILIESIEGWRGVTPRHDDVSILFVERPVPSGRQPHCSLGQQQTGKEVS